MCKKYLETVQNFHVVTCNKKVYQEENCAFFLETDFSQRTLVVIKFSTTPKLSETLHNFMISVTIAVWLNKDKLSL